VWDGSHVAADLDGDTDIDIFGSGASLWLENSAGTGGEGTWSQHSDLCSIAWTWPTDSGDLDGDGDLDIVGHSSHGTVIWLERTAAADPDEAWSYHDLGSSNPTVSVRSVRVADVDGDGDLDLLSGSSWWENDTPGDASSWSAHLISNDLSGAYLEAADLDGDGDTDFATSGGGSDEWPSVALTWQENSLGDGSSWIEHWIGTNNGRPIDIVDMNGDGAPDILGAGGSDETFVWWMNEDAASSWTRRPISIPGAQLQTSLAADLDGDGDENVVGMDATAGTITWLESIDPDADAWLAHGIDTSPHPTDPSLADVDGDGDVDLVGYDGEQYSLSWWENGIAEGDVEGWEKRLVVPPGLLGLTGRTADVDADGDSDVISYSQCTGLVVLWENDESSADAGGWASRTIASASPPQPGDYCQVWRGALSIADVDSDGDVDAVGALRPDGKVVWWENEQTTAGDWPEHDVGPLPAATRVAVVDLDGDGDIDILGTSDTAVKAWTNSGTGPDGPVWTEGTIVSDRASVFVPPADLDGDGDPDFVDFGPTGVAFQWWENDGSWTNHVGPGSDWNLADLGLGDIDGDSDIDVVGAGYPSSDIVWWENLTGSATAWDEHVIPGGSLPPFLLTDIELGDIDDDEDIDIVGVGLSEVGSPIRVWENRLNSGSPDLWSVSVDAETCFPWITQITDVDGDGAPDLLTTSLDRDLLVWQEYEEQPVADDDDTDDDDDDSGDDDDDDSGGDDDSATDDDDSDPSEDGGGPEPPSGGCGQPTNCAQDSVGTASDPTAAWVLAPLALAGLGRRRRVRQR